MALSCRFPFGYNAGPELTSVSAPGSEEFTSRISRLVISYHT